jgi:hypothetical protein
MAGAIASASATLGPLAYEFYKNPTSLIPKSSCDSSCDTKYLRQDCPNWFISSPDTQVSLGSYNVQIPAGVPRTVTGVAIFGPLMTGGPACAALSAFGWAATACNGFRIFWAMTMYFIAPDQAFNFILQGYDVGFTKPKMGKKTALGLTDEFADNGDGYWYAELPYVIEMTKIYNSGEAHADDRSTPLIIRKV